MSNDTNPDKWLIMKLAFDDKTIYKLVMGWNGNYLEGSSWRTNTGIDSVSYDPPTECYVFKGIRGNQYVCHKDRYGKDYTNELGYKNVEEHHLKAIEMSVMSKDTNWMTLKY